MEDLKRDLVEIAESIYHKRVTEIQMATHACVENFLHNIHLEQDWYEDAHRSDTMEAIVNAFAERVREGLQNIYARRDKCIAAEKETLEGAKDAIAWHCIAKEIGEHSVRES